MAEHAGQYQTGRALRALDDEFADWTVANFQDEDAEKRKAVGNLARAVSYALHLKHSCLDLNQYRELNDPELNVLLQGISPEIISSLDSNALSVEGAGNLPLTCNRYGTHVWLQKYHSFELEIAARVRQMAVRDRELSEPECELLERRFRGDKSEQQKRAVKIALTHRLSIITGGPGTGKTWTVARIIELLLLGNAFDRPPRIELAAPTGKAANRMKESIDEQVIELGLPADQLPRKASTLHSLLGIRYHSPKPAHDAGNPLDLDVLIIDEASMIDLPMMQRILQALPLDARLILLGDKDQLASVEAGSVLAELCDQKSGLFARQSSPVATITYSHRFGSDSEIGNLASAINEAASLPDFSGNTQVLWRELDDENAWDPGWKVEAVNQVRKMRSHMVDGALCFEVLNRQREFQILCALRQGPSGVSGINSIISRELGETPGQWYAGMPVMVRVNNHERKLYNGDAGMVLKVSRQDGQWTIDENSGELRACFLAGGGQVKAISMAQMPAWETCYALTVHKSQGSEYGKVLLVLPARKEDAELNPVLTRELLYTGVTRASTAVEIWSGKGVLESTVRKKTVRMSGLGRH